MAFVDGLSHTDIVRLIEELAGVEMAGLETCLKEFVSLQPLSGARITVSCHRSSETGGLTKLLEALGAEVRWFPCYIFPSQDDAAAADASDSRMGKKADKGYWRGTDRALNWGLSGGPDLIVDFGGDLTFLIHEGVKAEEIYAKTGQLPDPSSTENAELRAVLSIIGEGLNTDPNRYHNMKGSLVGVSEDSAAGVERLYQMQADGTLSFPAISVNGSDTKRKFSNFLIRSLFVITGATNMTIPGKKAIVFGFENASKGFAKALKQAGADVVVYEVDSNLTVQAHLEGFSVIKILGDGVFEEDIFVINGGNIDVFKHVEKMKNNTIIYYMDTTLDDDSDIYAGHEQCFSGMTHIVVNPQTDKWVFPERDKCIIVYKGYPRFVLSWSCTSHVVALLDLWSKNGTDDKYQNKVHVLPEHLENKVSDLHLAKFTAAKGGAGQVVDKKGILLMVVQACSLILGFMKATKVSIDLSVPKVSIDIPFSAILGN
ncbi:adenosylhomocysteinase-like [Neltuma alba]|uniref:adenosylhomocysteinase-like n=1 Tax=Neltuma alba TaxID=207710 RepID=UPI0010A2DDBB|nr:adenosylhomocysteinase-like [Prosopis alba]